MGFSSALQGKTAHDALLVRQDAELRLLEVMKRCLLQKVKCDKEYAIALTAAAQHGLKIDRSDDLQGSQVMKAWRTVMEEWEQTAKQFKTNAEFLESLCQDKLTHLYQDKRKARKTYQEEHHKIASQFTNISDDVMRKKCEYQKHLEYYKLLRSKFEEHYIKAGRGGRKLDDVRDKYQKACRKLHLAHNEYVLLISEASEMEIDFRTILLPGLLEHQQSIQEDFIIIWKTILQEASQYCDLTADAFKDIQKKIDFNLQNINPPDEYREFTERHKTSPAAPVVFQFDQTLIEDKDTLGKLQPNTLTVDNLTVDWLRNRLTELETSVKECQEKQVKMQSENGNGNGNPSPVSNGVGRKENNYKNSKEFTALRCHEKQMVKLADVIKTALNEVGCEELPSGCDDISVDHSFIENNVNNGNTEQPGSHATAYILQKSSEVLSLIRSPFRRKSASTPPNVTPKGTPNSTRVNRASPSQQSSAVNCMDEESISESSDWFSNNVYADVDVNANDGDRTPIAHNNCCKLTNSKVRAEATATLALPDDDDDDDTDDPVSASISTANELHLTPGPVEDTEVENLYECGTNACRKPNIDDDGNDSKESLTTETPSRTNKFFTGLSKSLRSKLKQKPTPVAETPETETVVPADITCLVDDVSVDPAIGGVSARSVPTLAVRLRERLRKLNFVKARSDSDDEMTLSTNRPLYEEEYFHGVLPREEVVRLLKNDGDFLVRETTRNEESQIVLSVCWNGHKHFIVQTTVEGHYRFEGPAFPSIQELIMHQHLSELPVTGRSGAVLKKPVHRERWELSNDDVILLDKIGRGNFGDVYKARLKSNKNEVAVKTCRMTLPEEQKRKFLQEGRILKQYDHPNIVKLIGICVQKQPIMIVMELVPGGSLLSFLRKNAVTLNTKQLMGMCKDAAAGMRYLESKNCIHRDLAARNCLIGFENTVKISDFGMSREEEEYIVSDGMKQIPIKWTAPEALNFGKYTTLCDVWSYGILVWEIFSKGDTPYTGMSNSRARERIDAGYRMPAPECATPEIYRLMLKCWSYEPETRPHFDEIYTIVASLASRESN